jgi:hypothetical protein
LLGLVEVRAQEPDPLAPEYIDAGVSRADAIVAGVFRVQSFYPWIDGWHYRGRPDVEEALYWNGQPSRQIPFRWLEKYGSSCLNCDRLSLFGRRQGIWLLATKHGILALSGTEATVCGGPLPREARTAVMNAIQRKKRGG